MDIRKELFPHNLTTAIILLVANLFQHQLDKGTLEWFGLVTENGIAHFNAVVVHKQNSFAVHPMYGSPGQMERNRKAMGNERIHNILCPVVTI